MILELINRDGTICERRIELGQNVRGLRVRHIKLEYGDIPDIGRHLAWFATLNVLFVPNRSEQ